ncbi:hypothetical protein DEU56DRAFT_472313 [Suillus clintonianus]|uniref:uncharacterized protein n=1 Tax=Suillus clintonianus TaxID=1904413 RepID=UPI001B8832FD|nr:uncharacterized protein DEU56DRAFT_472313 [Suillus clintonianus]KAG2153201.1 hypothetical protein DEU56DRAFT_472313 [Suillus clintonianus]
MVSTGMKPAPTGSASRTQCHDDGQLVPRPTPAEFRKLVSGPQENIIRAMETTQPAFEDFKKVLRDQAVMILDCERYLHEQIPDIWAIYLDWARKELAPFLSGYADAWPVELYIEHYLSKKTYAKRHAFRSQMSRRPAPKTVRVKSAASEREMSMPPAPVGPPPPYEEHDFAHPGTTEDSDIASFLKAVNPDLTHLVPAFEGLGISNEADLVVVKSWPPALRKEFFERELMGRMSALEIQALNFKLGEMN